jgi:hypothetical protein
MSNGRKVGESKGVGNRGKGRKKGVPNKATKALKDMILGALDKAGGEDYLLEQAHNNPGAFLTLIGKVLPQDIKASVTTTLTQRVVEVPKDE